MRFEYSVIPAPTKAEKAREAKTPTDRFALSLTAELNRMSADGWEYVRADVLPSEERSGLTGRTTVYHNVLVFRRKQGADPEVGRLPQPDVPDTAPAAPDAMTDRP
ncbi:DUF4177 domain-containing protein [Paracoccus sp. Ld10]|uniref:DUF4177 domain-containing protein n=1 Tax=Paracoccus sp. Ld10 TaxID=649158 RepID=UPI003868D31A